MTAASQPLSYESASTRGLARAAVYRRTVAASTERVWENVRDWAHLPWLHASSFSSIDLEDAGDWGWRARIELDPGREARLELVIEPDQPLYVSRSLDGSGAGNEVWTRVLAKGERETDIEVEFWVFGAKPELVDRIGSGFVALYTKLWDEDEAMMVRRQSELDRGSRPGAAAVPLVLGSADELRARLPLTIEHEGRSFRVVEIDGELFAHATTCPHMLGPLGLGRVEGGRVRCPWHGYEFDIRSRAECTGRRLRLAPAPRVLVRDGVALLTSA